MVVILQSHSLSVAPQILPFDFGEESVNSGESASVQCLVNKGDLPVEISWFHKNRSLVHGDGIIIMKNRKVNSLTIDPVSSENAGEYTCVATNQAGSASHSAVLNVNGICRFSVFDFILQLPLNLLPFLKGVPSNPLLPLLTKSFGLKDFPFFSSSSDFAI